MKRRGRRLTFERLEDRRVLATLTVTTLSDAAVSGVRRRVNVSTTAQRHAGCSVGCMTGPSGV